MKCRLEQGGRGVEGSLSVRRAWIEIRRPGSSTRRAGVALRKESVDRNRERDLPEPERP